MSDFLSSLGTAVAGFAPTLAGMLGGPLAAGAVSSLESATGISPDKDATLDSRAQSVLQLLQQGRMTPDMIAQARAENDRHAELLGQQNVDLAKINAAHQEAMAALAQQDTVDARAREMSVRDNTPKVLAGVVVVGYIGVQAFLLTHVIADDMREIVMRALGTMDAALTMVLTYYFGSSASSRAKDQTLADIAKS